ncbi:MAG: cell wall-binding repeat-containing protein [Actinomycetota bacterium]|nr:cell wall-binding repeat-containing protein [Actinomycetota bacterium]
MVAARHGSGRVAALVAALALAVSGLAAAPAGAADADPVADRVALTRAASTATASGIAAMQAQQLQPPLDQPGTSECFADAAGDTRRMTTGGSPTDPTATPEDKPQADITRSCVNFGPSLSLTVTTRQPTNPLADPNWRKATFVGWFLDTNNDGDGDFFVDYSLDTDAKLTAIVYDVRGDQPVETCAVTAAFTDRYAVSDVRRACIGDAGSVRASVAVFYDEDIDDDIVHTDVAPDAGAFSAPVATQARAEGRLGGLERMETSVRISQARFPDPADASHVYLARQDLFADAVAGGVLTRGPILLVPSCGDVLQVTRDEINRVNPTTVYALGGPEAICDATLQQAAGGRPTARIAGTGRVETAVEISRFQFPNPADVTDVYLARADLFVDAVVGGILTRGPILLVGSCEPVPTAVRNEINRAQPQQVVALGGTQAVCEQVLRDAAGERPTLRLGGVGRAQTAIQISRYQFPGTAPTAYITRADLFADAVVGGILIDGPILLVPNCITPPDQPFPGDVRAEISRLSPSRVVALGGVKAVCEAVLDAARAA